MNGCEDYAARANLAPYVVKGYALVRVQLLSAVLVAAMPAVAPSAHAQDAPREDGLYVRAGAGANFLNDWEQSLTSSSPSVCLAIGCNPDTLTTTHQEGFVAGGALGFDYADGIRTELEYRYSKSGIEGATTSEAGTDIATNGAGEDTTAHIVMGNFYFDFANESAFTPFIGGGVGGVFVTAFNGDRDAALAYQARAGVSVSLGPKFFLDTEYIYTRSQEFDFDPSAANGFLAAGGERYEASSVMASFRKQF